MNSTIRTISRWKPASTANSSSSDAPLPVPALIEHLSHTLELYPGDVVFTGTPAGVGVGRTPQRFLGPGDVLRSRITDIGELVQTFTSSEPVAALV